mmetsp:Transcript_14828/g.17383  ORF Transcript_14828/g.17383 Transcript_14828/m.17383 type:complete len:321 (+) Transcript_14828:275-1237(+)|eukprot:CAMPEP_0204824766 /NCGR_PEP_ID=MMETSP1346-20131115/2757_1 /ASSEMBLY_ACC=CAM_ASM_000771 /TAXON_ID=215587 /ORGANISM="Aplanochytrium stocchinoi, Strain GSBS06" /LENGTH=320 /DNA_ID=CAMNT_0051952099 /DNA_START=54 /DNA_END=1016 /DNA_ORIENTATION=-
MACALSLIILVVAILITTYATNAVAAGPIKLYAEAYEPDKHLLATVRRKTGQTVQEWVPHGLFYVTIAPDFSSVQLDGTLKLNKGPNQDKMIDIAFTFSGLRHVGGCFCASEPFSDKFGGSPNHPNYISAEKYCTRQNKNNEEINTLDQYFCPKCELGQCQKARLQGAPEPIWENWSFYTESSGQMTGDGLPLFRNKIKKEFPEINANLLECEPNIRNMPLAQLYCSDYDNPSFPSAKGFGVNGKNQKCGFAVWFNCEKDLAPLDAASKNPNGFSNHMADINLNLLPRPESEVPCTSICVQTNRNTCNDLYKELDDQNCF